MKRVICLFLIVFFVIFGCKKESKEQTDNKTEDTINNDEIVQQDEEPSFTPNEDILGKYISEDNKSLLVVSADENEYQFKVFINSTNTDDYDSIDYELYSDDYNSAVNFGDGTVRSFEVRINWNGKGYDFHETKSYLIFHESAEDETVDENSEDFDPFANSEMYTELQDITFIKVTE